MKTPNLDATINDLEYSAMAGVLTANGEKTLAEFKKIKELLMFVESEMLVESSCECVFPKPSAKDSSICRKCKRKI